jgi:hypothetical protein
MDPLSDVLSLLKPVSYVSAGFDAGGDWSIQFTDQHEHQMLRRDFRRVLAVRRGRSRHGASEDRNYRIVLRVICDTYRNLSPQRRNLFGEKILGAGQPRHENKTCRMCCQGRIGSFGPGPADLNLEPGSLVA